MKKALVFLLILAVAGGVFAQVTFSGHVRGGLAFALTNMEESDPVLANRDVPGALGGRVDLNGVWANEAGTAGMRFILRSVTDKNNMTGAGSEGTGVYPVVYEAWFKALDNMITIYGGRVDSNGVFGTGGGVDDAMGIGSMGTMGMFVNVSPISGLDIRGSIYPFAGAANTIAGINMTTNIPGLKNAQYNFGVRYLVTDIVDIIGIYRNRAVDTAAASTWNDPDAKPNDAVLGFKILALRDMGFSTFNLDFQIQDIMKVACPAAYDYFTLYMGQNIQYTAGDLLTGIRFRQGFRIGDTQPDYAPDLAFGFFIQYLINGTILPRLDAGFSMGAGILETVELRGSYDGVQKGFTKDMANLALSPSVQFRFSSANQTIQLGYTLQADLSDRDPSTTLATIRNTIYATYVVTF